MNTSLKIAALLLAGSTSLAAGDADLRHGRYLI